MSDYENMEIPDLLKAYNKLVGELTALGVTMYKERTAFESKQQALTFLGAIESSIRAKQESNTATDNQKAERKAAKGEPNQGLNPKKKNDKNKKKSLAKSSKATKLAPVPPADQATNQEATMAARKSTKKSTTKARKGVAKSAKTKANGARTLVADDARIVGVGTNGYREGTTRHKQLELAKKSGTVAKFVKAGGGRNYLGFFRRNGEVKVG